MLFLYKLIASKYQIYKKVKSRAGEVAQQVSMLLSQRTQVWFPLPTLGSQSSVTLVPVDLSCGLQGHQVRMWGTAIIIRYINAGKTLICIKKKFKIFKRKLNGLWRYMPVNPSTHEAELVRWPPWGQTGRNVYMLTHTHYTHASWALWNMPLILTLSRSISEFQANKQRKNLSSNSALSLVVFSPTSTPPFSSPASNPSWLISAHLYPPLPGKPSWTKPISIKFFSGFVFNRVLLRSPSCPGTHYVDQAPLKLMDLPVSASWVQGCKPRQNATSKYALNLWSLSILYLVPESSTWCYSSLEVVLHFLSFPTAEIQQGQHLSHSLLYS